MTTYQRIVLAARPKGAVATNDFRLESLPVPANRAGGSIDWLAVHLYGPCGRPADPPALAFASVADVVSPERDAPLSVCRHGAQIAVGGKGVQPFLEHRLLALHLFARRPGRDGIKQQNGGGKDGPGQGEPPHHNGNCLRHRAQPDEAGLGVGFQKKTLFGEIPLQRLIDPIGKARQHVGRFRLVVSAGLCLPKGRPNSVV